jgi:hypothetical protein
MKCTIENYKKYQNNLKKQIAQLERRAELLKKLIKSDSSNEMQKKNAATTLRVYSKELSRLDNRLRTIQGARLAYRPFASLLEAKKQVEKCQSK